MIPPRLRPVLLALACGVALACRSDQTKVADHQKRGEAYLEEKKPAEAILEFKNVLQIDPNHAPAHYGLARAYLETNQVREGYWELRETVRLDPANLDAKIQYGQLSRLSGELDEAMKQVDDTLAADPNRANAYVLKGQVLEAQKKPEEAAEAYRKAVELAPTDVSPLVILADFYVRQGNDKAAEPLFRKFTELQPGFGSSAALAGFLSRDKARDAETVAVYEQAIAQAKPEELSLAYRTYAGFLYARERYDDSEQLMQKALAQKPDDLDLIYTLARFYAARGDAAKADAMIEQATKAKPNDVQPFLVLSAHRSQKGDLPGALDAAESALKVDPESKPALLRKAELLLDIGFREGSKEKVAEGRTIVDGVLAKDSASTDALFVKAKLDIAEGRIDDAVKGLRRALELRADWPQAHFLLGSALLLQKDRNGAKASASRALELDPTLIDARRLLARIHASLGENDLAIEQCRRILQADPGDLQTRILLAQSLVRTDKAGDALKTLEETPEKDRDAEAWYAIGRLYLLRGDAAKARVALERADAVHPAHSDILETLLQLDRVEKRLPESDARIGKAVAEHPDDPKLLHLNGLRLAIEGQNAEAEKNLRRAIELAPSDLGPYRTLGQLLASTGRTEEVTKTYEQAATANPDNAALQLILGTLYEGQGRIDQAMAHYELAVKLDGSLGAAKNNLAYLLAEQGRDLDRALDLAQEAKAQLPDNANAADTLGWVLLKKGVASAAVGYLKEAEGLTAPDDPSLGIIRLHLAQAEEASGDPAKARETLERALSDLDAQRKKAAAAGASLPPEPGWAAEARSRLERLKSATG